MYSLGPYMNPHQPQNQILASSSIALRQPNSFTVMTWGFPYIHLKSDKLRDKTLATDDSISRNYKPINSKQKFHNPGHTQKLWSGKMLSTFHLQVL